MWLVFKMHAWVRVDVFYLQIIWWGSHPVHWRKGPLELQEWSYAWFPAPKSMKMGEIFQGASPPGPPPGRYPWTPPSPRRALDPRLNLQFSHHIEYNCTTVYKSPKCAICTFTSGPGKEYTLARLYLGFKSHWLWKFCCLSTHIYWELPTTNSHQD